MIDEKKMSRKKATSIMTILVYLAGIPSALSYSTLGKVTLLPGKPVLDSLDYIASNIMLPLGGMLIAIYAGYVLDRRITEAEITDEGRGYKFVFDVWYFVIRFVAPVAVLAVFLTKIGILKF